MPKGDFRLVTCLRLRRDHGTICIFHSSKHWIMEFYKNHFDFCSLPNQIAKSQLFFDRKSPSRDVFPVTQKNCVNPQ